MQMGFYPFLSTLRVPGYAGLVTEQVHFKAVNKWVLAIIIILSLSYNQFPSKLELYIILVL